MITISVAIIPWTNFLIKRLTIIILDLNYIWLILFFYVFMNNCFIYKLFSIKIRFFVVASSIVSAYLILSLAISILHIVKANAVNSRVLLLFLDTVSLENPVFQVVFTLEVMT